MNDAENNIFGARVKKEIEEDWSNSEMIHENITVDYKKEEFKQEFDCYAEDNGGISIDFMRQEHKQEVDWSIVKDEYLPDYVANVGLTANLQINFYNVQDSQRLFQCPECPVKVKYEANLNRHISFMHPKNKSVGITPRRIARNSLQIERTSENCGFVNNESKNNTLLLKKKKYKYSCFHCFFNCNYKSDFIYHVYEFHFDNNDSQNGYSVCPHCKKILHQSANQKAHMAYCTREKKFQCDYCSYRGKKKHHVKLHIFKKHYIAGVVQNESLKQFILPACSKCGKRYAHSSSLSNHIAFCGKRLPFQCKICSYASDDKATFIAHILKHLKKRNLCQDLYYR